MNISSTVLLISVGILGATLAQSQMSERGLGGSIFSAIKPVNENKREIALGRDLFYDYRLSASMRLRCVSCHDLSTNGASGARLDRTDSGRLTQFNTPTIFNSIFSYRLGWAAKSRDVRDEVRWELKTYLGSGSMQPIERLQADPALSERFRSIYGGNPDYNNVADALTWFVSTLVTPNAPFDRWLNGDGRALTVQQVKGYQKFGAIGCAGCHQGRDIGANLSEPVYNMMNSRGHVFNKLRVPSLRNVAVTAPYFHDGRAKSLESAVQICAENFLHLSLSELEVLQITSFLGSMTGDYKLHRLKPSRTNEH